MQHDHLAGPRLVHLLYRPQALFRKVVHDFLVMNERPQRRAATALGDSLVGHLHSPAHAKTKTAFGNEGDAHDWSLLNRMNRMDRIKEDEKRWKDIPGKPAPPQPSPSLPQILILAILYPFILPIL